MAIARETRRSGGQLAGVNARLYPYQVEGVAFLASNGRAVLADDMGLGKTLQAISAAKVLMDAEGVRRVLAPISHRHPAPPSDPQHWHGRARSARLKGPDTSSLPSLPRDRASTAPPSVRSNSGEKSGLVVCPASLKHQWAREIERFTGLSTVIVQGRSPARLVQYRRHAAFTLINYELVLRDALELQRELAPDLLILDEAQRIKNWRTKTASAIKSLRTRFAFVLSGTPLENRLEDLYSVMQVVDQRLLGPLWHFNIEFHVLDERGKVLGFRNLSELRQRLAPVLLRRDRSLVRDQLPYRIEQRLDIPLSPRQRSLHDEAVGNASRLARVAQKRPLTPREEKQLLSFLQNARMACNAAGLVDKETVGSPKLDELRRLLEELCVDGGRKVVIFSQWRRMTAMADEIAIELGLGTVNLHGGVASAQRGEMIDRFRDDPAVQVFLSTDAGGVGLNLQAASALINLDLPWNPTVLDQRIARIHRLGQRESVNILLLIAPDSYEERVWALLGQKKDLFRSVLAGGEEDAIGLRKSDVKAALEALSEPKPGGDKLRDEDTAIDPIPRPHEALDEAVKPAPPREVDLGPLIVAIQDAIGPQLIRILVSNGGLLALTDGSAPPLKFDQALTRGVAVIALELETYHKLRQFSDGALTDAGAEIYVRDEDSADPPQPDPFGELARRKLKAGEVLMAQQCPAEALVLLADAMRAAAVSRSAGIEGIGAPAPGTLALWLYSEAVPAGAISPEDAAILLRADALAGTPDVPAALADGVLRDARAFIMGGSD